MEDWRSADSKHSITMFGSVGKKDLVPGLTLRINSDGVEYIMNLNYADVKSLANALVDRMEIDK